MKIGILNLQGAVSEHYHITKKAAAEIDECIDVEYVRYAGDVEDCDGIIISGGESTVIGKLIKERGIDEVIKNNRIPVLGTCAGMILLAKKTDFNQPLLGIMDIEVKRNRYGRQIDSFESPVKIFGETFPAIFIRAPVLDKFDKKKDIEILSQHDGEIIAIQQDRNIAVSFHPELTDNTLIHEYFISNLFSESEMVKVR